ncbi:MAG: hypothetical protein HOI19_19435 [Rhodospirillaceae bacterium]|nr:hypothetical protein [Rhodospirillaceae bacterium]
MTRAQLRAAVAATVCVGALALYAYGFLGEPRLRADDPRQRTYATHVRQGDVLNLGKEAALAEAYWRRYGDVAADSIFGRAGQLGVHGAREHFNRPGQRENRRWGKD